MLALLTTIGGLVSAAVTAIATIFLWRVTKIMAEETRRMAEASSRPHIVATISPNTWGMMYADITIENVGTGPAYDIETRFSPPLPFEDKGSGALPPLANLSVLKPGQSITSFLGGWQPLEGLDFSVVTSWRRSAASDERESNSYTIRSSDLDGLSILGASSPEKQVADYIKKIHEDLKPILSGHRKLNVNLYDSGDRDREAAQWEERSRAIEARSQSPAED